MLQQLVGGRDGDGADLMQRQDGIPELVVALQHQHDPVAPLDAQGRKVVGGLAGSVLHILEGEAALGHIVGDVDHGQLVGILSGDGIHSIEGEVVALGVAEVEHLQAAVLPFLGDDELPAQQGIVGLLLDQRLGRGPLLPLGGGHNHGQEHAVLAAHGDLAMGRGALEEDAVALVEDLLMLAHTDLHGALQDQVEFLTGVGNGMDGLGEKLGVIFVGAPVRRGHLVLEHGSHVLNGDAVLGGGDGALASAGNVIAGQAGAVALQQLGQFHAEGHGTLVHKGKGQVLFPGLILNILIFGNVQKLRHGGGGVTDDLAHLADTLGNAHQLIHTGLTCHRKLSFMGKIKDPPQEIILRRVCIIHTRGTTQIAAHCTAASDSNKSYPLTRADVRCLLVSTFGSPARK